jgi:urease accessory protein
MIMTKSRELRRRHRQARPRHRAGPGDPLAPAKAGTQITNAGQAVLDPRSRGNERERGAKSYEANAVEASALYRLMAWLSPAYPIGAFSYSSGIEWAVEDGDISDEQTLRAWLEVMIGAGAGFCDAVFLVHAHRATAQGDDAALREVAELAAAFAPSKERHLETTAQGRAFLDTTCAAWPTPAVDRLLAVWDGAIALPVAVGVASAGHNVPLMPALSGYLQAMAANLISAGMRLIPLGQTEGQRVLAALEPVVAATAKRALESALDDVGGAAFRADLASIRHETQYTRLFRS